jgi:hypothetical protein
MGIEIKKSDEVWTADGKKLGIVRHLFHRTGEVNPALKLYATYLGVEDFDYGEHFYVPTEFVADRQAEARRIDLSKKRDDAMQLTWFRLPDFIAQGKYREEALPE